MPFMPLAVVLFGGALISKMYFDADDNKTAYRFVTLLIFFGMLLWLTGTIFVTESPLQLAILPTGMSATSGFWFVVQQTFSSQSNISLAMASFEACLAALAVMGLSALTFGLGHWIPRPGRKSQLIPLQDVSSSQPDDGSSSLAPRQRVVVETGVHNSIPADTGNSVDRFERKSITNNIKSDRPSYIG
jgi:hypothetical protein